MTAFGRRPARCGRTVLLGAGALLALLAGGVVAPGAARAACGDHVRVRLPAHQPPAAPAPPAKPCHGPHCSGGGAPILPAPAAPAPTADERWGQPPPPETAPAPGPAERFRDVPSDHPIRRTADVFHPPRLS